MSRTSRWKVAGLLVLVLGAAALYFGWRVRAIEAGALRLASTGRAAIALLDELAQGVLAGDLGRVQAVYDSAYSNVEGPWIRTLVDERDGIAVFDWSEGPGAATDRAGVVERYRETLGAVGDVAWAKGKLDRVESMDGEQAAVVRAILWLRGSTDRGETFESQARLRLSIAADADGSWSIVGQELLGGTTVVGAATGFSDHAAEWGLDFVARDNPRFSDPDWTPETFGIVKYAAAGVSTADYDGDGWYDLFYGDGASARLYRNVGAEGGSQRFRDVTARAGLPLDLPGVNVGLFADFDNDGDKDLFVGRFMDGNRLYRNQGDGTFVQVPVRGELAREFVTVAAAADYDGDGRLDLYLGRYLDPRTELPTTLFYTRNGEGNSLLRNTGDLTFVDVTEAAGVREGGLTLGVAWADYDDDGDPDLYVANDYGRNALLRNRGDGTFEDVTAAAGALDFGFGMSSSWGDVDNDGDFDLYVSNVHSGQRWYGQAATLAQYVMNSVAQRTILQDYPLYREIYGYTGSDWTAYGDGMVKGNSLLLNDGRGGFVESSETAGSNPYGWYWGSTLFDYDNDGRLDLYAGNGWISGDTFDDL